MRQGRSRAPRAMGEPRYLQAECAFRPGAHTVRVTLTRSALRVEVEAHGTADLWRGEFDATFIEDLTRKTGNFKQFGIFCSMLESALTQLSQAKSSEQRLHLRVKNLTAELASYRRGRQKSASPALRPQEQRSASLESHRSSRGRPSPKSLSPAGPRQPRFDPTAFVRAQQRRQKEAELRNQRRGVASGSTSPARSHRRSSSAESSRSWHLGGSSGSKASERPEPVPCRDRRGTRTRRPLSTSACNGPCMVPRPAASHKLPVCRTGGKRPGKENRSKEPSAELAEIDARLQALQEYMDSLNTHL